MKNLSNNKELGIDIAAYLKFEEYFSLIPLPVFIILAIVNNIIVCWILLKSERVQLPITTHIRIFYIVFAIGDMNIALSTFMGMFFGMQKKSYV